MDPALGSPGQAHLGADVVGKSCKPLVVTAGPRAKHTASRATPETAPIHQANGIAAVARRPLPRCQANKVVGIK